MNGFLLSHIFDISGESFFLSFVTFSTTKRNTSPHLLTKAFYLRT
uniref:Uncharacterized protein n=1 Tax=Siphoviridae sp. ctK0l2 TaxID=2826243 RepID=A0A8S5NJ04_9CAUD|nr:MAG TPA: hypothetical protein [Siphoviridae sp. ctK0l2]